jgi:tetratricopeptide (TPR) repeat protein
VSPLPKLRDALAVAQGLRATGDYQGAVTALRRVRADGDRNVQATAELLMGTILVEDLRRFGEAVAPLEAATQSGEPQIVPGAALGLARALRELGERGRALALYAEVMEQGERVPATAAAFDKAQLLADERDYPGAREALRWIVEQGSDKAVANAHLNLGLLEKESGHPDAALAELLAALDLGVEDDGSTAFAAAELLLQRGDLRSARTMFEKARDRGFAGDLTIQHLLGAIDERERLVAQALAAYESVWRAQGPDISVEVTDVRGEAALAAGRLHCRVGDTVSERSALDRAAELGADPVAAQAHYVLAKLDEADGDPQGANEHLQEAVQRGDVNTVPEAWLAVGQI